MIKTNIIMCKLNQTGSKQERLDQMVQANKLADSQWPSSPQDKLTNQEGIDVPSAVRN
jgi:hypothetical protein